MPMARVRQTYHRAVIDEDRIDEGELGCRFDCMYSPAVDRAPACDSVITEDTVPEDKGSTTSYVNSSAPRVAIHSNGCVIPEGTPLERATRGAIEVQGPAIPEVRLLGVCKGHARGCQVASYNIEEPLAGSPHQRHPVGEPRGVEHQLHV